jgi:tetratricopeptide (TPR) repeat protein
MAITDGMRNGLLQNDHASPSRLLRRARRAQEEGELTKAERLYAEFLQHQANSFEALHGLGQIHYRRGRLDAALACFQEALKCDLSRAEGFASLGLVFHALRDFARALTSYEQGLRLDPDRAELLNGRGVSLLELRRPQEALACFDRVLASRPDHADALGNRGNALLRLNRVDEAVAAYERVLELAPSNAPLLANRAAALRPLDRPHEALMSALKALAIRPDFAHARFVEAVARLSLGDFAGGWEAYEARWHVGWLASQRRDYGAPLWLGKEPLAGKIILLHAEQGLGDTIQFVRYAPLLTARGAAVVLEVQQPLVRLLSNLPGVAKVVARNEPLPPYHFHCPLLSLPLACATTLATIPAEIPYIAPHEADVACWRARLPRQRPLVGLAWSGERSHDNDLNRSMRLETLLPLFDLPGVAFVSLQHEVREEDRGLLRSRHEVIRVGEEFNDFADTAAAVAALDAVIAVDTAVAHLAGALGKPVFLLLPYAADFRWLRGRNDSPWYPTARLFRQQQFGDWAGAVGLLRQALTDSFALRGRAA